MKFLPSDLTVKEHHDGDVAVYMSGEFGLAERGEEHVEDWLECFWTECHRRPQQVVTQWGQCHDTDWAKPCVVRVLQSDLYLMRLQSLIRREKRTGAWRAPPTCKPSSVHHCSFRNNAWFSMRAGTGRTYWWCHGRDWSLTDRWLVSVTPSIQIDVVRQISGDSGGWHGQNQNGTVM